MKYALFALAAFFVAACGQERTDNQYSVAIVNRSKVELRNANVKYGNFHSGGGYLPAGVTKTNVIAQVPWDATATVTFDTPDGQHHEQQVPIAKRPPEKFSGTLYFIIKPDLSVELKPISSEDEFKNKVSP